jgi:hypothetical protein
MQTVIARLGRENANCITVLVGVVRTAEASPRGLLCAPRGVYADG